MLTLQANRRARDCDGSTRRDFLRVGALGAGGFGLSTLLAAKSQAAKENRPTRNTSVIWLWLGGGPTHVETFDPNMSAPIEYRSTTGEVKTNLPGVTLGGNFEQMAQVADKMAFVRSFAHTNSGHGGGTHFLMTGYDNRNIDNGGLPTRPSLGSITSRIRGANHRDTGMPTYVRLNGIGSDGPAFLGTSFAPFGSDNTAKNNMRVQTPLERISDRRGLLAGFDKFNRKADRSGLMDGLDSFEKQAFNLVLSNSPQAFDVKQEDPRTRDRYGSGLGEQLLVARRLCEAGCGFVTVSYGGWDMHGNIKKAMDSRGPVVDRAVGTLVEDLAQRSMLDDVLVVVTGEFGRTPRINRNSGRDHWAPLTTLAMAGGGLKMGQVVGKSDAKGTRPATKTITPQDLMATVFHTLGIDQKTQFINQGGRPVYMLEDGKPISELV